MRRARIGILCAVMATSMASFGTPAWAGDDLDDFELVLDFTDVDEDDHGKDGPSDGDEIDFEADLLDEDDEDAGTAEGDCELDDVEADDDYSIKCTITFELDDGDIEVKGTADQDDLDDNLFKLSIEDGTDDYEDAEGKVKLEMKHHDEDDHPMFRDHDGHHWKHHKLDVRFRFDD